MVEWNNGKITEKETRKLVFVKSARVLSEDQWGSLSENEKSYEETCGDKGVWLELFCPDNACFSEEEQVRIPVFCEDPKIKKSYGWSFSALREAVKLMKHPSCPNRKRFVANLKLRTTGKRWIPAVEK